MRFVKMHGIGNDYVYLDAFGAPALESRSDLPHLARAMADRHRGVGSDGLILVCRPVDARAHVRMRMFNADGSESPMCGNGVRCVAKFAHDRLAIRARPMRVETGRGVLSIDYTLDDWGRIAVATVDMGEPILDLAKIPADRARLSPGPADGQWIIEGEDDRVHGSTWRLVSMGNPHAVLFCDAGDSTLASSIREIGPALERSAAFPQRINVHLVRIVDPAKARMFTWERGAGVTQACGTGACAVLVAGVLAGRLQRQSLIHLPGGDLTVRWDEKTNHVFMTGSAEDVYEGEWPER